MKLSVVHPVISGIIIGTALFRLGELQDAPGLCLIGTALAFLLIMWGTYNAGLITKSMLVKILLFSFGIGGLVMSVILYYDGEFEGQIHILLIAALISATLISIGIIKLMVNKKSHFRPRTGLS